MSFLDPQSITGRLILTLTLGMTVLWLVGAVLSSVILQHELSESFDRAESEVAQRLLPLATDSVQDPDAEAGGNREHHHGDFERGSALVYQLRHADGRILLRSEDAPDGPLDAAAKPGFSNTGDFRIFTLADPISQLTIQVGELLAHRDRAIWGSTLILFLPLLLLIPLTATAIWVAARRGLRPLGLLRQEIAARDSANLAPLAVTGLPQELTPIATALASLIDRLRSALDAERQFAANSAHELRTPIAAALAQTQRLIETTPDEGARAEARKVEATLRRLSGLAEKLLQLARADAGMAASADPTPLLPVLQLVIADISARSKPEPAITIELPAGAEQLRVPINIDALGIVLRNLIDNAVVHSPPGKPIRIAVSADGDVCIRNEGAIVAAEALSRLRRRFERGTTVATGSGLGLAIVEAIMQQIGGELLLRSPIAGGIDGFEADVRFAKQANMR
jgi:two-component system OmpR family sensor kinase